MIITLLVVSIFVVWLIIGYAKKDSELRFGAWIFGMIAGTALVLMLIFNPVSIRGKIAEFHAIEQTLSVARNNPDISQLELAAIQTEVVKANTWLANNQYYRRNKLTSWFVSGDVMKLEPIR